MLNLKFNGFIRLKEFLLALIWILVGCKYCAQFFLTIDYPLVLPFAESYTQSRTINCHDLSKKKLNKNQTFSLEFSKDILIFKYIFHASNKD